MFPRKIEEVLDIWAKSPSRKPLVLRGARQVGKSTAVRLFSRQYRQFLEFNLDQVLHRRIFAMDASPQDLIRALFFEKNANFDEKNTLIFLDEIQDSPQAMGLLRYFKEDFPEIHVIAAGSLLEHYVDENKSSFPVGRVEFRFLRPLSFAEFLLAIGEKNAILECEKVPLAPYAHAKLQTLFAQYCMIGGMPEVVQHWIEHRDVGRLKSIFQGLLISYGDDARKYARSREQGLLLQQLVQLVPLEAGSRIVFEKFGNTNMRSREIGDALRTLERALLLQLIYPCVETVQPALSNQRKRPRLQFLDTGLVNFALDLLPAFVHGQDISAMAQGRIAEHMVGQELDALSPLVPRSLRFWVRESSQANAEVDFVFVHEGRLLPLEVKAGAAGAMRSLHQFVDRSNCRLAVRFWSQAPKLEEQRTPAGTTFTLLNLPHYLAAKLPEYLVWAGAF